MTILVVLQLHKIYKNATLFFSQDGASTIANVIPTMEKITSHLKSNPPRSLHRAVKSAMELAQNKLERYFGHATMSEVYRVAMGMSPSLY